MFEIWYVNTHTYVIYENTTFSTKALLILLMPVFFPYLCQYFCKNSTFTQSISVRVVTMTSQFANMKSSSNFLWRCFVSLVKFSYWSEFHINIITGSGVTTIFIYEGLTRNLEIRNTPVWISLNIWRLGRVKNTKSTTNASNEMLLNATKCQSYSFYLFRVIKGKLTGGVKLPPPRLGVKGMDSKPKMSH